ncbi:MAG TPA: AbrB/MazE/SpoVT family DNA-binding domain-containing protein [Ktedonobacterales bacterium]
MDLVKVRKADDGLSIPLPAELIAALHLAEDDVLAVQQVGEEIVLRRAAPESEERPRFAGPYPTAAELMQLPLEERHRLLAAAAAEAAEEYRTNPELMEFSTALDGEDWEEMDG